MVIDYVNFESKTKRCKLEMIAVPFGAGSSSSQLAVICKHHWCLKGVWFAYIPDFEMILGLLNETLHHSRIYRIFYFFIFMNKKIG